MSESETQEQTQAQDAPRTYTQADLDRKLNNLVTQIKQRDEKLAEIARAQQEAEQKTLADQQQYRELAETLQRQIAETEMRHKSEIAERERRLEREGLRRELASAGLVDEVQHLGLIALYEAQDEAERKGVSEFVASLRERDPGRFAVSQGRAPANTGAVGSIKPPAPSTLEDRLQSKDPKIKLAALKEQFQQSVL